MIFSKNTVVRGARIYVHYRANVICFHASKCGHDLQQAIGHLKARRRPVCNDCGVGINLDTGKRALAAAALRGSHRNGSRRDHDQILPAGGLTLAPI
jgi:hypothetical protein